MKKRILGVLPFVLAACSTPEQQSTVPMDMKTVQEYQQKVASGNTVNPNDKQWDLNASDRIQKVRVYHHHPRVRPNVGYFHSWGSYRSRIGLGLGYY